MFGVGRMVRRDPAATLRVLMAERDVTTQELADLTGLAPHTISAIRTGRVQRPKSDTRYLIAEALEVKPNKIWPDV